MGEKAIKLNDFGTALFWAENQCPIRQEWNEKRQLLNRIKNKTERNELNNQLKLNKKHQIEWIYNYLLNNYGLEYAFKYLEMKKEDIKNLNLEFDMTFPFCEYSCLKQCSLFCSFYLKGKCLFIEMEEN